MKKNLKELNSLKGSGKGSMNFCFALLSWNFKKKCFPSFQSILSTEKVILNVYSPEIPVYLHIHCHTCYDIENKIW